MTLAMAARLAVLAVLFATHVYAYRAGAAHQRAATLERSIDALRKRTETNDEIKRMPDPALCGALGGRMSEAGACE